MELEPGELDVQTQSDKVEVLGMQLDHCTKQNLDALIKVAESSLQSVSSVLPSPLVNSMYQPGRYYMRMKDW